MRILLLSAYDAVSHRQWRHGLAANLAEHEWTILTLPDRHFSWRVRGNAFSWATEQQEILSGCFDLIVATSMVDLATLKGLAPMLAATPSLLYFHENQFAYPKSAFAHASIEAQITSVYSAMAAKRLLFNSEYNRNTFLQGAEKLIKKMPDHAPTGVIETLKCKSAVLSVPLDDQCIMEKADTIVRPLTLVWNHRWEYDKGPDRLYLLLKALCQNGLDFRLHIIGQQFRQRPEAFDMIKATFMARIETWGYIESRSAYLRVLGQSDIVVSTALHDFQGLSMLEAMACGCIPVAPNRLAYAEFIPQSFLSDSFDDAKDDAAAMAERIIELASALKSGHSHPKTDMTELKWSKMADKYRACLRNTVLRS